MTIKSNKKYFKIKNGLWKGYNLWDLYNEARTPLIISGQIERPQEKYQKAAEVVSSLEKAEEIGKELIKFLLCERVKLVVVALSAARGKSHPNG